MVNPVSMKTGEDQTTAFQKEVEVTLHRKLMSMSMALVVAQSGCASPEPQTEPTSAETERFEELYVETPDSVRLYVRILAGLASNQRAAVGS